MGFLNRKRRADRDMDMVCAFMEEGSRLRQSVSRLQVFDRVWGEYGERWEQRVQEWLHRDRRSFEWQFLLEMPATQQLASPFAADIHIADWMNRLDRRLSALSKLVDYLRNEQDR